MKKYRKESLQKDEFFVAVKLLLRKGDELLIIHDSFGDWDLPGGRLRKDQFNIPLEEVLRLKIVEEIGPEVKYRLGDIKTTFRVERREVGRDNQIVRIFAVGYEAEYLDGDIKTGSYHEKQEWINIKTSDLSKYASPGSWIEQLKNYQKQVKEES